MSIKCRVGSGADIAVLTSPLLLIVTYRLLLDALVSLTSYAWIVCNALYYLLCLLLVVLLGGATPDAILDSFRPRITTNRKGKVVTLAIAAFFVLIGASSFASNSDLILRYFPQTALFMAVNPFFEELYWRGLLFGKFRERWLVSAAYSSVMFGVFHYVALQPLMPHLLTPYALLVITIFGFLWAVLYHLSGTLLTPYICHSISDIVGYLAMSGLPVRIA